MAVGHRNTKSHGVTLFRARRPEAAPLAQQLLQPRASSAGRSSTMELMNHDDITTMPRHLRVGSLGARSAARTSNDTSRDHGVLAAFELGQSLIDFAPQVRVQCPRRRIKRG